MVNIRRLEELNAVRSVEYLVNALHSGLSLLLCSEARDNSPALWVEPHRSLGVLLGADYDAVLTDSTDKSVLIPASRKALAELSLYLVDISDILGVVSLLCVSLDNAHSVVKLECNEGAFALLAHSQTVVPVSVETGRHLVCAQSLLREADSVLEVLINGSLSAACLRINDDLIKECLVSCLADILVDSREQPESVIGSVRGMSCLLSVNAVLVVLIRTGLVACVVVELNERQSAAV